MPYKIAIASGKGGTGKTTVSVTLYHFLNKHSNKQVQLVDCDVEEPNDKLFFAVDQAKEERVINQLIPKINTDSCTFCRRCVEYCEFNAIVVIPPVKYAEVNSSLCHSCGACMVACEDNAITEHPEPIGKVIFYETQGGNDLIEGNLKIGSAMQTLLIKELKKNVPDNNITIYDSPPGTSCPVVETMSDANYVVLVTEPTPFGLYDLKLMVELLKDLEKPYGVVINKAGIGNDEVYKYLKKENIELIGEIPFSRQYASNYANGNILNSIPNEIEVAYSKIVHQIENKISEHEPSLFK